MNEPIGSYIYEIPLAFDFWNRSKKITLLLDVITSARQQFGSGLADDQTSGSSCSSSCDSPRHSPSLTQESGFKNSQGQNENKIRSRLPCQR